MMVPVSLQVLANFRKVIQYFGETFLTLYTQNRVKFVTIADRLPVVFEVNISK